MDFFVDAMLSSGNLLLWHFFKKLAISRVLEMHFRAFLKSFIDSIGFFVLRTFEEYVFLVFNDGLEEIDHDFNIGR